MSTPPEAPAGAVRVGYLGPQGTFSEEALLDSATAGAVESVALPTIYDTVVGVREGLLDYGIVPIENSLEGSINVTLDLLAGLAGEVQIVGETLLRVRHSLIAAEMLSLAEIESVITHPQVPGQCTRLLRGELAHAQVLAAASTAEAVRSVVEEGRRGAAALGTVLAAEIYGARVIREGVEDRNDNETRFVWIARVADAGSPPPLREDGEGEWKTSLVFWGLGAERPGWLLRCLQEFAGREINLTRIESRPRREQMGSYMFFVDLGGSARQPDVAGAIAGLGSLCEEVCVLGSYRAARQRRAP